MNGLTDCYFVASVEEKEDHQFIKHTSPMFMSEIVRYSLNPVYNHHISFFFREIELVYLFI